MAGISVEEVRERPSRGRRGLLGGRTGLHRGVSGTAILRAEPGLPAAPRRGAGSRPAVPAAAADRAPRPPRPAGLPARRRRRRRDRRPRHTPRPTRRCWSRPPPPPSSTACRCSPPRPGTPPRWWTWPCTAHLAGRREILLRRSQELQQEFTALAFAGRGLPAIVERLAALTGLPEARLGGPLAALRGWATPPVANGAFDLPADLPTLLRGARLPLLRWAKTVRAEATPDVTALPIRADSAPGSATTVRLVVPFVAEQPGAGYLSLLIRSGAADGEARLALAGAGLAASIEALRARAVTEAQGNAAASLVRDWLAGLNHPGGPPGHRLGHTPPGPRPASSSWRRGSRCRRTPCSAWRRSSPAAQARPAPDRLPRRGARCCSSRRSPWPTSRAPPGRCTPCWGRHRRRRGRGGARPGQPGRLPPRRHRAPRPAPGGRPPVLPRGAAGAGHRPAPRRAPPGRLLRGPRRLPPARRRPDGRAAQLLPGHPRPPGRPRPEGGGGSLRTLDAYIASSGSPLDTAQRLHAHRNTVLYRLDRIAELLGVDVRHPEQRLLFHLALRAGEVLGKLQPGALSRAAPRRRRTAGPAGRPRSRPRRSARRERGRGAAPAPGAAGPGGRPGAAWPWPTGPAAGASAAPRAGSPGASRCPGASAGAEPGPAGGLGAGRHQFSGTGECLPRPIDTAHTPC